jgi:hypothetical protein
MMDTSRRALLGAIAIAPLVATAAGAAGPSASEWNLALAAARKADEDLDVAFAAEEQARDAWQDRCEALRPAMLTDRPYAPLLSQLHELPLDQVAVLYEPPHVGKFGDGASVAAVVGAYREKRSKLREELRVVALGDESRAASKAWRSAYEAAIRTPAPTIRSFAEKIALLKTGDVEDDHVDYLLADANLLAGRAAR